MSDVQAPTPAPTFLEKLGAEALDLLIPQIQAEEAYVLAFVDGEIAAGITNVGAAVVKAITAKVPLVGGSVGNTISAELTSLEPTADAAAKKLFDEFVALLQAKAKAWGG